MSDDKLVRMANDIAAFFGPYAEVEAVAGIRHHIASYWTPKMRTALEGAVAAGAAPNLSPRVVSALGEAAATSGPTQRETAGPAELGEIGASDAG